ANRLPAGLGSWPPRSSMNAPLEGFHCSRSLWHTPYMAGNGPSLPDAEVRLAPASPDETGGIQEAIRLGNGARSTLGYLPYSAYTQAAANGTLLLAYVEDKVVGYALYDLASGRVRLT